MDSTIQVLGDSGKKKHGAGGRRLGSMRMDEVHAVLLRMGFEKSIGCKNRAVFTRDGKEIRLPMHMDEVGRDFITHALRHADVTEEQFLENR